MTGPFLLACLLQCSGGPPFNPPHVHAAEPGRSRPVPATPPSVDAPRPSLPGPATPSPAPAPRTAPSAGPRTAGAADLGPDLDWADWWWLNAYAYLRPEDLGAPSTQDDPASARTRSEADAFRSATREAAVAAASDPNARVRTAAALTAGRLYDPSARPALLGLLEDGDPVVRRAAVGALGLTGAEENVHLLLRLGTGASKAGSLEEKDMALLALGVGASGRGSARFVPLLRSFLSRASENERRLLGPSAATSLGLAAGAGEIAEFARVARDAEAPAALRARALWALGRSADASARPTILASLEDRQPDVRRAAALALGRLGRGAEEEVVAALRRVVEKDGDTAARAFALLSMGEVGGPTARRELVERARRGKQLLRPWAAIGAGLLARASGDREVGASLAQALDEERNRDTRAALALALGLSRTGEGRERVRRLVQEGENTRERVFASLAIALGRDADGREALRRAIREIPSPSARTIAALALATFRDPGDAPALLDLHSTFLDPVTLATSSLALAWNGSEPTLARLRSEIGSPGDADRRSSALLALGIGVSRDRVPTSVSATAGWNYLASLEAAHFAARLWL